MVSCMANLLQHVVGDDILVRHAHMELAEPSIAAGFADCVRNGATEVIAFPYMLSPGKHVTRDVPRLVAEAAQAFPQVSYRVTGAFGVHEKLAELILGRAGLAVAHPMTSEEATRCWHSSRSGVACGDACRCHPESEAVTTEPTEAATH